MAKRNSQSDILMKAIGQLFEPQYQPQPLQKSDLAQYILTHSLSGPSKTVSADIAGKQGASSEGHSLLSKVFDLASSGLYSTTNVINDTINAVHQTNKDNQGAGAPERLWNMVGKETGKIAGSILKNAGGAMARSAQDSLDIVGQVSGLDQAPVIGGLEKKLESGAGSLADKLTPRMMPAEVLDKQLGVHNKLAKYGGGFAASVALDPITYVPGLDIVSILKKGRTAQKAAQGFRTDAMLAKDASGTLDDLAAQGAKPGSSPAPDISLFKKPNIQTIPAAPSSELAVGKSLVPSPFRKFNPASVAPTVSDKPGLLQSVLGDAPNNPQDLTDLQALRRSDNATRAANVRWKKPVDWHDVPDLTPTQKAEMGDQLRQAKMAKKGVVSDGKGNISNVAATNVVEDIQRGIIPRFGPTPVGAEGAAAERAVSVADRAAGNLDKASRKGLSNKVLTPEDQTNLFNSVRNEAARMVNETFDAKPKPTLNPKQESVTKNLRTFLKDSGKLADKPAIQKELDAMVKAKTINKGDAKTIMREFFPAEKIRNFAVTKLGKAQVNQMALQMYRTAEDHLVSQGIRPVYHNGMQVRLSEVLADAGVNGEQAALHSKDIMDAFVTKNPSKITDPVVREAVTKALARRSLSMSDMLAELSTKTIQVKNDVLKGYNLPTPVADHILGQLPKQARETAQSLGATSVESKAMADHVQTLIDSSRLPQEKLLDKIGRETATALMDGTSTVEQRAHTSRVINEMLKETPDGMAKDISQNKAIDGWFIKMSTWKGRPEEIKRFSQDSFLFAEVNASERGKFFRQMGMDYTPEQLKRGFTLAQQPENLRLISQGLETDPQVLAAANVYKNYFDWMLGSTGFDKLTDLGGTVSAKSGMIMADVNRHLKAVGSKFQFTDVKNGKYVHATGDIPRNYSEKGIGWMHSWENARPIEFNQDPLSFMYDMDLALQRTTAEYATFDEFARRFGARVGDSHFNPEIHKAVIATPRLGGFRFHPDVAQEMGRLIKDLETAAWSPSSPMMRNIIKGTRVWKSSVTIYRPIHHIRNVIGDAFNMWLAGHNNPTAFSRAIKVLETQKPRYAEALKSNSIDNLKSLIDTQALDTMSLLKPEVKATDAIISKGGVKLDSEQLWASGYKRGLFLSYNRIEDLFGQTPMGNLLGTNPQKSVMDRLVAPFGGKAHDVATKVSEHREHFVRMAHYIAAVEKGIAKKGSKNLEAIFDDAAHEVRKYHPDGTDLTNFEQHVRVIIPFYAWTRKEIPLLAQAMVERPGKLTAYPKLQQSIAGASGIPINENQGMLDPYPNDQLFPDWIRASGIGPIGDPQSTNPVARFWAKFGAKTMGFNGPEGYVNINPSNPFNDVTTQLFGFGDPQDSMRAMVNSMNPGLQIPASLAFDKTFSGAPISTAAGGQGVTKYLESQIPQIGEFTRLSGVGRNDKAGVVDKTQQNLINFLTGAGILGSGPYQKSAEFEAKARAKQNATGN